MNISLILFYKYFIPKWMRIQVKIRAVQFGDLYISIGKKQSNKLKN
jgi:hypothetical protein